MAEWKRLDLALARMARLPAQVRVEVEKQLDVEAEALADAIRANVPVDTGVLRDTIRVSRGKRPLSRIITAGGPETRVKVRKGVGDKDFARARASGGNRGEYDYMRAVEFGHMTADGRAVPAQPFFYPTYRARRKAMRRRIFAAAKRPLKTLFPE